MITTVNNSLRTDSKFDLWCNRLTAKLLYGMSNLNCFWTILLSQTLISLVPSPVVSLWKWNVLTATNSTNIIVHKYKSSNAENCHTFAGTRHEATSPVNLRSSDLAKNSRDHAKASQLFKKDPAFSWNLNFCPYLHSVVSFQKKKPSNFLDI